MFQYRMLLAATAAGLLTLASGAASAAPCRDAAGHFTACPKPAKAAKAERCRGSNGAFVSCNAPSAMSAASPAAAAAPMMPTARQSQAAPMAAGGVTAKCKDGTFSHSLHRSGSCSGHGGVAAWM